MGVNPEISLVEAADCARHIRRQYPYIAAPDVRRLPGALARTETPGMHTEQERPIANLHGAMRGAKTQGITGALPRKRAVGVGLFHSSCEAAKVAQ